MASGIVLCYDTVGAGTEVQRVTPCASQTNFSVLPHSDFVDWGLPTTQTAGQPYGLGLATDAIHTFVPTNLSSWDARSTGLVTASVNVADGSTGGATLLRADNGSPFIPPTTSIFTGHFNSQPNGDAQLPYGDHLVGFQSGQGPMRIDFDNPIASVGFYISTKTLSDFTATVKMYDHINPLSSDIPVLTYRIDTNGNGGGGDCASLAIGVPCNDAPFVGLDGNSALLGSPASFRSIVISTDDNTGFFIDSMYLGEALAAAPDTGVPEPASALLIGGGMAVVALASRKFKARG